jgi:hypothetical protein
LEKDINILGKRNNRNDNLNNVIIPVGNIGREEMKNDGLNVHMNNADDDEEYKLTDEDKELMELYGQKIRVVRWYFENDKVVKQQKK